MVFFAFRDVRWAADYLNWTYIWPNTLEILEDEIEVRGKLKGLWDASSSYTIKKTKADEKNELAVSIKKYTV